MTERIVRPDGEVRYLSSNGQVVIDETGTPVRMRGTCIDITDRVLAEEEREAHAARVQEEQTRRQAALEINDNVVQGLTAALYALELEDTDSVRDYVRRTLDSARAIITDLVGPLEGNVAPGDLVRTSPLEAAGLSPAGQSNSRGCGGPWARVDAVEEAADRLAGVDALDRGARTGRRPSAPGAPASPRAAARCRW